MLYVLGKLLLGDLVIVQAWVVADSRKVQAPEHFVVALGGMLKHHERHIVLLIAIVLFEHRRHCCRIVSMFGFCNWVIINYDC